MSTKPAEENCQTMPPLFLVGVPRSGTSLLYALLNQHPQIALMYEADLPLLWPLFLKRRSRAQWLERWNFWNEGPERHQINISRIPENITDIRTATESAYREYASHKSASIWGCKSPNQYDSLERIASYFPNARFIMIWRDPADVCRSMIRAREGSIRFRQTGLTHRALLGCGDLGTQRDRLRARGLNVHELQYEDLIRNPGQELQKICTFLSIPYDAGMENLGDADRSAVPVFEHNAMVRSEKIVARQKREEVLPPDFKKKIERYKNLWQRQGLDWAVFPVSAESGRATPSIWERAVDRIRYRMLRAWDSFVVFAYCVAPVKLLIAYRGWKGHPCLNSNWHEYVRASTEVTRPAANENQTHLHHSMMQ
jgi:Sulfotransferase family